LCQRWCVRTTSKIDQLRDRLPGARNDVVHAG
jgi:hypothetical protein